MTKHRHRIRMDAGKAAHRLLSHFVSTGIFNMSQTRYKQDKDRTRKERINQTFQLMSGEINRANSEIMQRNAVIQQQKKYIFILRLCLWVSVAGLAASIAWAVVR